ncbi:MAG TPA: FtsX-like permease family protein [Caulobacteraceae bacterium]|jgi:putative ABC transport system permease protein
MADAMGAPATATASGTALRWMIAGEWRAYPTRVILAALAIAIGVALGFAVHLINASALTEFDRAIRTVNGDADLQVHAASERGFDERLYPRLARLPGLAGASPAVELKAQAGEHTPITLLGLDLLRAVAVTPNLLGKGAADPFDDQALYLSPAALQASGRRVGDTILVAAAGHAFPFVIAGDLPGVQGEQRIGVVDIAAAQWRFGQLGRLQRVDLKLAEGADPAQVSAAVAALLPTGAEIVSRQSETRRSDSLSRAYRVNLDMLALVALLTGGFLVYSAQSLSVARRRPQFALLRVLGVNRRALLTQILVEALAVGGLGALAGLGLGLALAAAALDLLGGDLGGGYFRGAAPHLAAAPGPAAVFGALGLAVALAGSLLPARAAADARPAVALKNLGDAIDPSSWPRVWPALALLAAGTAAAFAPAVQGLPILGYLSIALLLAGGVAVMPWLARVLLSPLRGAAISSPPVRLAVTGLWGAPSQAAIALCGIVASTSLMIAMAVMVSSFRTSVEDWLLQILPADLYLTLDEAASGAGLDAATQARLASLPGVQWVGFLKDTPLRLKPDRPPVSLIARAVGGPAGALPLLGRSLPIPAGQTPVWVSEPAARLYGWRAGDRIVLPIAGVAPRVFVAGVWRDYARQYGAIAIDGAAYTRLTGDAQRTSASIAVKPGASEDAVARAVRAVLPPPIAAHATLAKPREIRARALQVFDRSFAITYLLEAVAIVVGLAGVATTISAQTLARTKEFGMLRHVGVRRIQISAMLATEGALLGAVGGVAGIGLGLAMSQVLIHVVNPQSFHWTMETRIPWPLLAVVAAVLVISAAGAALLAGRRALSADAIRAVREDW